MPKIKPSILFIMKDARLRNILMHRFEREGWKVQGSDEIADGERKAVKLRPLVFLVELEEAEEVKKHTRHWKSLPTLIRSKIVILLPKAERRHVDEALTNGADQVILSGTLLPKEMLKSLSKLIAS